MKTESSWICGNCGKEFVEDICFCDKCKKPKIVLKSTLSLISGIEEDKLYTLFDNKEGDNMNGNEPAFPIPEQHQGYGLTKREYFAGLAMQGMLANSSSEALYNCSYTMMDEKDIAGLAVRQSDELIKELSKSEE